MDSEPAEGAPPRPEPKEERQMGPTDPDPWADPKSRSTIGFCNLHHRIARVQNLGIYFWILPGVWESSSLDTRAVIRITVLRMT